MAGKMVTVVGEDPATMLVMAGSGGGGEEKSGEGSDSVGGEAGGDIEEEDDGIVIDMEGISGAAGVAAREVLVDDPLFPSNPMDIKVDGEKTLRDKIEPLNDFWRTRADGSHAAAQRRLFELMPELRQGAFVVDSPDPITPSDSVPHDSADVLNHKRLIVELKKAGPLRFYRSTDSKSSPSEKAEVRNLGRGILERWSREQRVFLQVPPSGMSHDCMVDLALGCPRIFDLRFSFKNLGLGYLDKLVSLYPQISVSFQIIFSHLAQHILTKNDKFYREAYVLRQVSTILAGRAGGADRLSSEETELVGFFVRKFCRGESFSTDEMKKMEDFDKKIYGAEDASIAETERWQRPLRMLAPSLALVDRFSDTKKVKEFIDARLSLLLPTKKGLSCKNLVKERKAELPKLRKVVQEDFITLDLIAFARAHGVYEQYKDIFEAIAWYRQLQFFIDFHLAPDAPNRLVTPLLQLISSVFEKKNRKVIDGREQRVSDEDLQGITVSSFGCGTKLFEKILLGMRPLEIKRIDAVDKHEIVGEQNAWDKIEEVGPKFRAVSVPVPSVPEGEKSPEFIERTLGVLPAADVVIAADSLHETSDPRANLIKLFRDKAKDGKYLYVSDPVHCVAGDAHTTETLGLYDNTNFLASMLALEGFLEILSYLSAIGAEVVDKKVVFPNAGYGDGFARLEFVLRKLPAEKIPYNIPVGRDAKKGIFLDFDEEIFEIFPLNLIPEDQRRRVLGFIGPGFSQENSLRRIEFADVRSFVIARVLNLGDVPVTNTGEKIRGAIRGAFGFPGARGSFRGHPGVKKYLIENRCFPYPVEELLRVAGEQNDELRTRNRMAADVIALRNLLVQYFEIDITYALRKTSGWEYFV